MSEMIEMHECVYGVSIAVRVVKDDDIDSV